MLVALQSAARSLAARVSLASPRLLASLRGRALILMYHRVIPRAEADADGVQPGMFVTPETFDEHLRFFSTHCTVLPLAELLDMWDARRWDDRARYCAITFDDGWRDNY